MSYSQPLKDINNAILTNQQIQAAYKKAIESNAGTLNVSYIKAFRSLFYLLDEYSVQDSLDLNIKLSNNHFSVVDKRQSILFFEHLLSLYSLGGECEKAWSSEGVSPELSSAIEKAITPNDATLFLTIFSVFDRIDVRVSEGEVYSISRSKWDEGETIPWQVLIHPIEESWDYHADIVLFPKVISSAKDALNHFPWEELLFMRTKNVSIEIDYAKRFSSYQEHISSLHYKKLEEYKDSVVIRTMNHDMWLVLPGEDIQIPQVSKKLFEADDSTPNWCGKIDSVNISFAIKLEESYYSSDLSISRNYSGISLYSSANGRRELVLPFFCNAPFVYENGERGNISLTSTYNKWLLSIIPDLYFKQVAKIPSPLIDDRSFSTIIPYPYKGEGLNDAQLILGDSIKRSCVEFVPSVEDGKRLRLSDCFINKTSILHFDGLVTKYRGNKYSLYSRHDLHGTIHCGDLIDWEFTLDDAIDLITQGEDIKELAPADSARLLYELYLSLKSSDSYFSSDPGYHSILLTTLANSAVLLTSEGQLVSPGDVLLGEIKVPGFASLNDAYSPFMEERGWREFLYSIGVYEYHSVSISEQDVEFLTEGYRMTLQFLRNGAISSSLPNVSITTQKEANYSKEDEIYKQPADPEVEGLYSVCLRNGSYEYWGVVDNENYIVIPLGYERKPQVFDTKKNLVVCGSHFLYSFEGKELFPGDDTNKCGMEICCLLGNDGYIVCDNRRRSNQRFYHLRTDFSFIPFVDEFYEGIRNGFPDEFDVCDNGLIIGSYISYSSPRRSLVFNSDGHIVIPDDYGDITYSRSRSCFIFSEDGWSGVYDSQGNYRFGFKSGYLMFRDEHEVDLSSVSDRSGLIKIRRCYRGTTDYHHLYGFADENLSVILQPIFDRIVSLFDDYYRITINGKDGVYSAKDRQVIIPAIYDYIGVFGNKYYRAVNGCIKEKDEKTNRVSIKGGVQQIIAMDGTMCLRGQLFEHLSWNRLNDGYILAKKAGTDGKTGVLDMGLNELVPFEYDYVIQKNYGQFFLVNNNGQVTLRGNKKIVSGGVWGLFSANQRVVDCKYDSVELLTTDWNSYAFRIKLSGKYGLINETGALVVPVNYSYVSAPRNNVVRVNEGGRENTEQRSVIGGIWHFYDIEKAATISPGLEYDFVGDMKSGYAVCSKGGKFGYINEKYEVAIGFIFDKAEDYDYKGEAKVVLNGNHIIIDKYGRQVGEWQEPSGVSDFDYDERDDDSGYSRSDLDSMYRQAYEGDPDAQWNND